MSRVEGNSGHGQFLITFERMAPTSSTGTIFSLEVVLATRQRTHHQITYSTGCYLSYPKFWYYLSPSPICTCCTGTGSVVHTAEGRSWRRPPWPRSWGGRCLEGTAPSSPKSWRRSALAPRSWMRYLFWGRPRNRLLSNSPRYRSP
jgi:hypothetical protein